MQFTDQTLVCIDCSKDFLFTAGEQQFFKDKNFQHTPKRCKSCRAKLGGKPQPVVTEITCSGCGAHSSVPFKPTQGRPVFCNSCFSARKNRAVAVPA